MRLLILFLSTFMATFPADVKRPKVLGVAQMALNVGDVEKSRAFYKDFLGLSEPFWINRPDGSLAADDGQPAEPRFEALRRGWVSITRPWHLLTTNGGAGNPHAAAAEKGRRLMELLVDRLATFLVELSSAELDERFPY